jgi:hypothetical protein
LILLTRYYFGDQIMKNEMARAGGMSGGEEGKHM